MAVTITNRASLRYTYGAVTETVASNVASTVVNDPLNMTKTSLETAYRAGEAITYIITVTNGTDAALSNVTIEDDLGAYSVSALQTAVPLTYEGPAQLYSDGVFFEENRIIKVYTPTALLEYGVFAALPFSADHILYYNKVLYYFLKT